MVLPPPLVLLLVLPLPVWLVLLVPASSDGSSSTGSSNVLACNAIRRGASVGRTRGAARRAGADGGVAGRLVGLRDVAVGVCVRRRRLAELVAVTVVAPVVCVWVSLIERPLV